MKEEILKRLNVVLNALNSVEVRGKSNLANQSGSIAMIEEVCAILSDAEVIAANHSEDK
nr:MAG TPA: hypothetical protein [Caudoviricetes sp.]